MAEVQLAAEVRSSSGTKAAKDLRRSGYVPAITYRGGVSQSVAISEKELEKALAADANLITITVGDDKRMTIVKDVQREPIKGSLLHVDFYEVAMDEAVTTSVAVVLINEEDRVDDGAVVNQLLYEMEVSCLPMAIPDRIRVDVSELKLGDTVLVKDLDQIEGVEFGNDPEETVLNVREIQEELEEEPEDAELEGEEEEAQEGEEEADEETAEE